MLQIWLNTTEGNWHFFKAPKIDMKRTDKYNRKGGGGSGASVVNTAKRLSLFFSDAFPYNRGDVVLKILPQHH